MLGSSLGFSLFCSFALLNIFPLWVPYAHSCVLLSEIALPNMSVCSHSSSDTFSAWSSASASIFAPEGTFWLAIDEETDYYVWVYSTFCSQKYQLPDMKALCGTHWASSSCWGGDILAGTRLTGPAQGTDTYSKILFYRHGLRWAVSGLQNPSSSHSRKGGQVMGFVPQSKTYVLGPQGQVSSGPEN